MPEIRLSLLGPPNLTQAGTPLKMGRRKAFAILSYLAVTSQPQRRETLAALFWPESGSLLAFSYLRRDLAVINKAFGPGWLEADREQVALAQREGLQIDVLVFRELLHQCSTHGHPADEGCPRCIPLLGQAVALYRGDFMMGFSLPDSQAFDDWQLFEQESLRHDLARALGILVQEHSAQGEYEEGISYVRRWLQFAPWNEAAHRQLMQLYAWSGDRSAALRQYQECVRLLDDELGQPPDADTRALYEAIQSGQIPAPPTRTLAASAARRSLPPQPSAFVGREAELSELKGLLVHEAACRLVTLVGQEGVGKTRLATWAAEQVTEHFPHGVFLVPLAPIRSADLLVPTIAAVLKLLFQGRTDPKAQLLNYMREKRILLVLDGFEQILDAADLLPDILDQAPGVKLLVTSSVRLNLRTEWVRNIDGLEYPQDDPETDGLPQQLEEAFGGTTLADAGEISFVGYGAVQLFVESVRRALPDAILTRADRFAVVRICQLAKGLPLGLELAAAWAQTMSLPEIEQEIQRNLDFSSTPMRDEPQRNRILRALLERSWQFLSDQEQHALMQVSVFRGGFTREAAAQTGGVTPSQLAALVERSMLRARPSGRYDMHPLVRQFALGKLRATPDAGQEARTAHCHHYLVRFLHERESSLKGAREREALDEIAAEIDNVRAAWQWAAEHALAAEIARGLESLYLFYSARGWVHEGNQVFRKALESLEAVGGDQDETHTLVVGQLLARLGRFAHRLGMHRNARELLRRSLVTYARLAANTVAEDNCQERQAVCVEKAFSLFSLGVVVRGDGEYKEARRLCRKSYELYRACSNRAGMAMALKVLGILSGSIESYIEAQRQLQEALNLYQEIGDPYGIANTLNDMGFVAAGLDQNDRARRYYQDSLRIRRQIGDLWGIGGSLNNLGYLAFLDRSYSEAKEYLQESLYIQREIGDPYHIANCLHNLGAATSALGERYEAATYLHEALRTAFEIGASPLVLEVLATIGTLLAESETSDPEQAAKLLAFVLYHPLTDHWTRGRTEKTLVRLVPDLPLDALATAQKKGEAGELDTVVVDVLSHRDAWLAKPSQFSTVVVSSL